MVKCVLQHFGGYLKIRIKAEISWISTHGFKTNMKGLYMLSALVDVILALDNVSGDRFPD